MTQDRQDGPFPAEDHNHGLCVDAALERARRICDEKQIKLTALRESILREIAASHHPVGAYDIIERISGRGRRLAPISVYRILDLFLSAGLIHRVESRNAFFMCSGGHGEAVSPLVMLCEDCGRVAETEAPEALGAITRATRAGQFLVRNTVLEVKGRCADCGALPQG
jgi:Fur family zinc uptake transcriptional regulator